MSKKTIGERFWEKVNKTDTCWLWTSNRLPSGYGTFHKDGKPVRAHRLAYEWIRGPIPKDLQLDHLCRIRHCVNPDHLDPVTGKTNILRGEGWAAHKARQTHCVNDHPFDLANTGYNHGHRRCRKCHAEDEARRRLASTWSL